MAKNALANASSPYLRQHADNPVDWYEWGEQAFAKARAEDKPIFLSVGYSSCHWCHVMAHESFEDDAVAAVLNERFVSVKVDREERPDVDAVYMSAVQAMNQGRGGWPMSVFTTPDGKPFYAGTYYPPDDRHGMPGFMRVLDAISQAWQSDRDKVVASSDEVTRYLAAMHAVEPSADAADTSLAERAAKAAVQSWDDRHGGFGRAPKFPQAMTIDFLLANHLRTGDEGALQAAAHSLEHMAKGGIYDHVGGGFARYSVDEVWLVPHFEKMLYDNALLLRAYHHGWQVTGSDRFARVVRETAEYLLREMRHPSGGFYSATDADSEGIEGKFFVWSKAEFDEVVAAVGEDPDEFAAFYGVTEGGNFSDPHHPEWGSHTILHEAGERPDDERVAKVRQALYERRETRVHPGLDDKVLTSWNGLVIGALAEAGYADAAADAARFVRDELVVDGRLQHTWKDGHGASVPAFLEDVAYLAQGLLVLYEADHDPTWFTWARELAGYAEAAFADDTGSYYTTAHDAEQLVTRPRDLADGATPAGSSVMADVHLRLFGLTGDLAHRDRAEQLIALFQTRAAQAPTGYGELLRAMERLAGGPLEVAIVGEPTDELVSVYRERWRPAAVLAVGEGDAVPLLSGRDPVDGKPAAYVCRNFVCDRPVTDPDNLRALL